jgi:hypothetical protein
VTVDAASTTPGTPPTDRSVAAERVIGRLLIAVTYVAVGLLTIGVVLMVADGISPLSVGPVSTSRRWVASCLPESPPRSCGSGSSRSSRRRSAG